eukprot:CAMPEP_0119118342 /NCGR_PEP_ID=MMETSP1310-20130426/243_1 /TAXON_ID=464262 /ORGANISM="Genus nov. species nov., Strain RCC2339" /LENGTH=151 /DNA_ID=CAMNT_0007107693 /DNA_START=113 /DNA_END=568 /DNA_ORIENTATION=+
MPQEDVYVPETESVMTKGFPKAEEDEENQSVHTTNIFNVAYYKRETNSIVDSLCCFFTSMGCASFCWPGSFLCTVASLALARNDTSSNHFSRAMLIGLNVVVLFWYLVGLIYMTYLLSTHDWFSEDQEVSFGRSVLLESSGAHMVSRAAGF